MNTLGIFWGRVQFQRRLVRCFYVSIAADYQLFLSVPRGISTSVIAQCGPSENRLEPLVLKVSAMFSHSFYGLKHFIDFITCFHEEARLLKRLASGSTIGCELRSPTSFWAPSLPGEKSCLRAAAKLASAATWLRTWSAPGPMSPNEPSHWNALGESELKRGAKSGKWIRKAGDDGQDTSPLI